MFSLTCPTFQTNILSTKKKHSLQMHVLKIICLFWTNKPETFELNIHLQFHTLYENDPNTFLRMSLIAIRLLQTCFLSILSNLSLCTWHTARWFNLFCVMLLLSQVFSLLKALKLRSACAEEAGTTSRSLRRVSTCLNRLLTSGTMVFSRSATSPQLLYW